MSITDAREKFFFETMDFSFVINSYKSKEFNEYVVDRYGDVIKYRVYGDSPENFRFFEK